MSYHDDGVGQLVPITTIRQMYVPPALPPALTTALTPTPAPASGSKWMVYAAGGLALVAAGVGGFFVMRKLRSKTGSVATKNRR